jgi:hypothetical protein
MKYVQIENRKSLYRDIESGAIINIDKEEFRTYQAEVEMKRKENEKNLKIENKVNQLENDVSEIKDLLRQLVAKS